MFKVERVNEKMCVEADSLIHFFVLRLFHVFPQVKCQCFRKEGVLRNIYFPASMERKKEKSPCP